MKGKVQGVQRKSGRKGLSWLGVRVEEFLKHQISQQKAKRKNLSRCQIRALQAKGKLGLKDLLRRRRNRRVGNFGKVQRAK